MNALKTANDELVEKGIATSNEKMSIYFLVDVEEDNLAGETETTVQEIVNLVIAQELEENCEGEGGEEEAEIELRPAERTTLKEATSALDVFLRFAMNGYSGPTDLISLKARLGGFVGLLLPSRMPRGLRRQRRRLSSVSRSKDKSWSFQNLLDVIMPQ